MASRHRADAPLVVITGPTASGKTALAIRLAAEFQGEIICADSRTLYKGMDIGTAKPTAEEQAIVPHWGLDLVEPGERFTAADFKAYANVKIEEIRSREHVPFLVGGTGMYIDAVIFDYSFNDDFDIKLRTRLESMTLEQLHDYSKERNVTLPENKYNKRYVIRSIERRGMNSKRRMSPIDNTVIVGISTEKEILKGRITKRTEQLFANGVVVEATLLGKKYGWKNEAMTGNAYSIVRRYLLNDITLAQARDLITTSDWQLAKRQVTWFRRNQYLRWLSLSQAEDYLRGLLVKR